MRPGTNQQLLEILAAAGITTALMARLEFKSQTEFVWTGSHPLTVMGSGDSLLDGNLFACLSPGLPLSIGDNSFSYSGSDSLSITLAIPSNQETLALAAVYPDEYRGRPATLWRALLIQPSDPLAAPAWVFRRVRSGTMSTVEIQNDGRSHTFTLTLEGHAGLISASSQATYLDQKRFDPTDTSQDYAAGSANDSKSPMKGARNTSPSLSGFGMLGTTYRPSS